ncbi:MAG: response regulator [Candidatus Aminicenantes bacterium]|nr:response regulator [Candidatus Aminicenantes bacterium]
MQYKIESKEEPGVVDNNIPRNIVEFAAIPLSFIENTLDGVYICEKGILKFCNRRFAHMFGYKKTGDPTGLEMRKMIYSGTPEPVEQEPEGHHTFIGRRSDGSEFEVETLTCTVMYHGRPAIQGIVQDISKLRQLEKQLRQAQKMEVIGTLASGIAHDFNNILSIIMGYIELSRDSRTSPAVIRQNLKEALKASLRAKDLVQQILTFSRRGEKEKGPVKITSIVQEVIKLMRASLPSTIEIHQDMSKTEYIVLADPTQLHQVLMNLCTNAAQAMMEEGGLLKIELSDLNRDMEAIYEEPLPPSPYLRLTVSDTGHGMSPETKERIFEPFFTTKKSGEGTGMGLAVVKGIVKNHDGEISVESEPGKGTSFHLFLPLLQEDAGIEQEKREGDPTGGDEHVLLVEDEKVLLNIVKRMLERLGYRVVSKANGVEALEAFRSSPQDFDVVITDLTMPGMTGIQLAREVIKIEPEIPIIICTGFNEGINREHLRNLGMQGFIMKPYSSKKLNLAIREVLD